MNSAERTVLQNNHMELARDIVTTEEFLGICYQQKLFDSNLTDLIRNQPGIKARTFQMLELLPTRGPDAFQKFLDIIEKDYHWLAEKLRNELEKEVSKIPHKDEPETPLSLTLPLNNNNKWQKDLELVSLSTPGSTSNQSMSRSVSRLTEPATPKDCHETAIPGTNIMKKKINNFMTQQFISSRKVCHADKQAIENFITEQIREVQRQCHQKICEVRDHRRLNDEIQNWLQKTYKKIERSLGHINHCETIEGGFCEAKITTKDVEDCIHQLTEQQHKLEHEIKKCMSLFGENHDNFSLAFLVENIISESKKLKKDYKKLSHEHELMVSENCDLTEAKQKIMKTCAHKDVELEVKERQIKHLNIEKQELKREIDRLHKLHVQHLEKEKTLLNLQQMVHTLKEQNNHLADETEHLKNKIQDDTKRFLPRRSTSIPKTSRINYPKYKQPAKKKTK